MVNSVRVLNDPVSLIFCQTQLTKLPGHNARKIECEIIELDDYQSSCIFTRYGGAQSLIVSIKLTRELTHVLYLEHVGPKLDKCSFCYLRK
jgi:hypothetical protein